MRITNYQDVPQSVVEEGAEGVKIRWLISEKEGAPTFSMRHFEIAPGGHTPRHSHEWEHEVFILRGAGEVLRDGEWIPLGEGDVVFIPPCENHQFRNQNDSAVSLLCLIPNPE
jgi:quercetin dioxygenase-like cupin family protein